MQAANVFAGHALALIINQKAARLIPARNSQCVRAAVNLERELLESCRRSPKSRLQEAENEIAREFGPHFFEPFFFAFADCHMTKAVRAGAKVSALPPRRQGPRCEQLVSKARCASYSPRASVKNLVVREGRLPMGSVAVSSTFLDRTVESTTA